MKSVREAFEAILPVLRKKRRAREAMLEHMARNDLRTATRSLRQAMRSLPPHRGPFDSIDPAE